MRPRVHYTQFGHNHTQFCSTLEATVAEFAAAALPFARGAAVGMFVVVAVVSVVRARRGGPAGWRAAVMFSALAIPMTEGWIEDVLEQEAPVMVSIVGLVLLVLFPYLLFRFTATFRDYPTTLKRAALVAAGAATVFGVMLTTMDSDRSAGGTFATVALLVILGYWAAVSLISIVSLWRAGAGQPTVARRRMRLMSAGAALLTVALLLAAAGGGGAPVAALAVQCAAIASAIVFGIGLYPPTALRLSWRRPEEEHLRHGTMAVLGATTPKAVARELLPPTVRLLGGAGAILVDADGRVVDTHGDVPRVDGGEAPPHNGRGRRPARVTVPVGDGAGRLEVWTSPYTPYFAPEEIELLRTLGAVAGLALDRCHLLEQERARRAEAEQAHDESLRAREDADRANLAKSEFLSRMSHELRTPLNAILGFSQLLELSTLNAEDSDAVEHILKAGRHLLALINDVLDLARIEAGRLTISAEPVEAAELVQDAITLMAPLAGSRSIRLTSTIDSPVSYVMTDRQRCRQVLLNLLSNAVKYNHDGGEVEVRTLRNTEVLRISVRDTGPGIDPTRHEELFEPFERLGAESSGVEGTGLGLSLSKQLMHRLGGAIGVDSVPGEGSTFWIDLPLTEPPSDGVRSDEPEQTVPQVGEFTLLLVEDNLANLRLVEAMLRRRPHITVVAAMQGTLAIELAAQHRPDVIVLDLHLPDIPGREVLHRLKADPRTRDIPIIIASADATPGAIQRLMKEGASAYVTKPLHLQTFLERVDQAIAERTTSATRHTPYDAGWVGQG